MLGGQRKPISVLIAAGALLVLAPAVVIWSGISTPAPSASPDPAVDDFIAELPAAPDDGLPVLVTDDDAAVLALEFLGLPADSEVDVTGPVGLPGAGRHWVVRANTEGGRRSVLVGTLVGDVVGSAEIERIVLGQRRPPAPITIPEARRLAIAALELPANAAVRFPRLIPLLEPPHDLWCSEFVIGNTVGGTACVNLVTGEVLSETVANRLDESQQELRQRIQLAETVLGDATAARRLVVSLEPDEEIVVLLRRVLPDDPATQTRLDEFGLRTVPMPEAVGIRGPWDAVLGFVTTLPPQGIAMEEDRSALRPLAQNRPAPQALAAPYTGWPPTGTSETGDSPPDPRLVPSVLDDLARRLRTVGGERYDRLEAIWACLGGACQVTIFGHHFGSGRDRYDYAVSATGVARDLVLDERAFQAIPRVIVREAERIARADLPTAALIAEYNRIVRASRAADDAARVTLWYERDPRPEAGVALPNRPLAATTERFDRLWVEVDIRTGTVVSTLEQPADPAIS